jgi:hypothetical protein
MVSDSTLLVSSRDFSGATLPSVKKTRPLIWYRLDSVDNLKTRWETVSPVELCGASDLRSNRKLEPEPESSKLSSTSTVATWSAKTRLMTYAFGGSYGSVMLVWKT